MKIKWQLYGTVSTHSRPKAAGSIFFFRFLVSSRFNTQPPEGGWRGYNMRYNRLTTFQHTAARRRLVLGHWLTGGICTFQHTAARRRLGTRWFAMLSDYWFQHTAARRRLGADGDVVAADF